MDIDLVIAERLRRRCRSKYIENLDKWKRDIEMTRSTYNAIRTNDLDITQTIESEWIKK